MKKTKGAQLNFGYTLDGKVIHVFSDVKSLMQFAWEHQYAGCKVVPKNREHLFLPPSLVAQRTEQVGNLGPGSDYVI